MTDSAVTDSSTPHAPAVRRFANDPQAAPAARRFLVEWLGGKAASDVATDARLIITELVTNAVFHTDGVVEVRLRQTGDALRIEVHDASDDAPMIGVTTEGSMTGRGLKLVAALATQWGVERAEVGKTVWAELATSPPSGRQGTHKTTDPLIVDTGRRQRTENLVHISLGNVPTDLLLSAKAHVENLLREFTLASSGARRGEFAAVPPHLTALLQTVLTEFRAARLAIKEQAIAAANSGRTHLQLELDLPISAAEAGDAYLRALDEADAYCRAARLLTLETPPHHRVFRQWYVGEVSRQLRAAAAGDPVPQVESLEQRLLAEIETVATAHRLADRAARLHRVAAPLASAGTPEAVSHVVLTEAVDALGAFGGGILLATDADRVEVPDTVGYDDALVARLRSESRSSELPAAYALRTGEAVWLESRADRDRRFPELAGIESGTVSLCAVPLEVGERRLGALRFSFSEPRLFDQGERDFVHALAAIASQALERTQLYRERLDANQRLQRSLLPQQVPAIPGLDVAARYLPLGAGLALGGDFYDVWSVAPDWWAIAIGDVCGTGPEAAGMSTLVRYTLKALTFTELDPALVLRRLDSLLAENSADELGERFCTALLGMVRVEGDAVRVQLASGGHPGPLIRRRDGTVEDLTLGGTLLGVLSESSIEARQVDVRPGDAIVFFTDGATEARHDGEMFGVEGLKALVRNAEGDAAATADAITTAVLAHSGNQLEDDLAVLVLGVGQSSSE